MADNFNNEVIKYEGLPLYNALYTVSEGITTSYGLKTSETKYQLTVRKTDGASRISFVFGEKTITKIAVRDENHNVFKDYLTDIQKIIESDATIDIERKKGIIFAFSLLTMDPQFQTKFYDEPMITFDEYSAIQAKKIASIQYKTDIASINGAEKMGKITPEDAERMRQERSKHQ